MSVPPDSAIIAGRQIHSLDNGIYVETILWDRSKTRIQVASIHDEGCTEDARMREGRRGGGVYKEGEKKARERGKAHRRLTRIYGFVGLANKESARETGFSGRHSLPRARVKSLVAVESTKTLDPRHFGYRGPRQRSTRAANLWPRSASRAKDTRTAGRGNADPATQEDQGKRGEERSERRRRVCNGLVNGVNTTNLFTRT